MASPTPLAFPTPRVADDHKNYDPPCPPPPPWPRATLVSGCPERGPTGAQNPLVQRGLYKPPCSGASSQSSCTPTRQWPPHLPPSVGNGPWATPGGGAGPPLGKNDTRETPPGPIHQATASEKGYMSLQCAWFGLGGAHGHWPCTSAPMSHSGGGGGG